MSDEKHPMPYPRPWTIGAPHLSDAGNWRYSILDAAGKRIFDIWSHALAALVVDAVNGREAYLQALMRRARPSAEQVAEKLAAESPPPGTPLLDEIARTVADASPEDRRRVAEHPSGFIKTNQSADLEAPTTSPATDQSAHPLPWKPDPNNALVILDANSEYVAHTRGPALAAFIIECANIDGLIVEYSETPEGKAFADETRRTLLDAVERHRRSEANPARCAQREWTAEDERRQEEELRSGVDTPIVEASGPQCPEPATHLSCQPYVDTPTCAAHKCRCARAIADPPPPGETVTEPLPATSPGPTDEELIRIWKSAAQRTPESAMRALFTAGRASLEGEVKALRDETWYLGTALEESQQALASAAARVKEIETDLEKHRSIMSAQTETISELEAERQDAVDESFALADTIADSNKQLAALQSLTQVALEAVRLIWHDNGDRCGECGLIGAGELKSALLKLLGPEPWKLIWGNDANIDREAWDKALAASGVGKEST